MLAVLAQRRIANTTPSRIEESNLRIEQHVTLRPRRSWGEGLLARVTPSPLANKPFKEVTPLPVALVTGIVPRLRRSSTGQKAFFCPKNSTPTVLHVRAIPHVHVRRGSISEGVFAKKGQPRAPLCYTLEVYFVAAFA